MATVSIDLLSEGKDVLSQMNSEEIHKLGDRIISAEPDNWFGLLLRGCGYAVESDMKNAVTNWGKYLDNVEDENIVAEFLPSMCTSLCRCIIKSNENSKLDFSEFGQMLVKLNDKLPECDDEVIVSKVFEEGIAYLKSNSVPSPVAVYHAFKALAVCSFRAYVELDFFTGFFNSVKEVGELVKPYIPDAKVRNIVEEDGKYLDLMLNSISCALEQHKDDLDKYEEYWLEHKTDAYLAHILQSYNMSNAAVSAGRFTAKLAKTVMESEVKIFIAQYFAAKV